jgi:hypothetical protein
MSADAGRQREHAALTEVGLFGSADYELLWPPELVVYELAGLRRGANAREVREQIVFLLEEAFLGDVPAQDFAATANRGSAVDDPWGNPAPVAGGGFTDADDYVDRLLAHLPRLRAYHEPAPYWPARHGRQRDGSARTTAAQRFAALIGDLHRRGYFSRTLPVPCVDEHESVDESQVLAERIGVPDLWPLRPDTWDEDTFFGLIEVFHDLAVRPRERIMHSHNGCGWHYSAFSTDTGRALYRWRINRLLTSTGLPLRLAKTGEDTGRLVRTVDQSRTDLLERALQTADPGVVDRVAHAIAQFRARAASVHDKRSAVLTLAGILEERRELIHDKIGKKDEGALFGIANEFAIRHRRRGQHSDYDPIFLDWIFWWYLGTIELTDQLLARPDIDRTR